MTCTTIYKYLLKEIEERRIKLATIHREQTSDQANPDEAEKAVIKSFKLSIESLTLLNVLSTIVENPQMTGYKQQLEIIIGSLEKNISNKLF